MTLNGVIAVTLRYFNQFAKSVPTHDRFLEHWTYWSKVGLCNTYYSGEVSVRN